MDKYEFNIKVEQLKKLVNKGDYETAMKIADTIDWRRVRNANLLSLVSSVYEKNHEYHEAKEILLIAFERAPIGKRLLYKLTQLALKEGEVAEAEAYYREFCSMAEDDSRQYILRYLILRAKNASVEQLIHALESYTSLELDEKWLYQLAELYSEAGMEEACVQTCDKIMLMFGLGQYVDKAMELKLQYAPLSRYQMDLVENRDKYEEKLKAVEEGRYTVAEPEPAYEEPERDYNQGDYSQDDYNQGDYGQDGYGQGDYGQGDYNQDDYGQADYGQEEYQQAYAETAAAQEPASEDYGYRQAAPVYRNDVPVTPTSRIRPEEDLRVQMREAEVEEHLAQEMSRLSVDNYQEESEEAGDTRVLDNVRNLKQEKDPVDKTRVINNIRDLQAAREAYRKEEEKPPVRSRVDRMTHRNHLMIEAETPQEGLDCAVDALRKLHHELGTKNPVAKISGDKLNHKGLLALADKLAGKDLIIEDAADLDEGLLDELNQLMAYDETGIVVVLIDTPERMEDLHRQHPALASHFECIGTGASHEEAAPQDEEIVDNRPVRMVRPAAQEEVSPKQEAESAEEQYEESYGDYAEEDDYADEPAYEEEESYSGEEAYDDQEAYGDYEADEAYDNESVDQQPYEEETQESQGEPEEEMTIDEFAHYATQYASQIDCSITGKSMLALYERIEIMEEDNIPLTKANAEALIEEAADKAEKPSLGKMIKGVFSSKYDKDGLLILKEEHFI